jgi:hypothetical protein
MKSFTDRQIQFEQVFDGGYRYLDRCGEFMETVRKELNFMHVSVNPAGCDMESTDSSIRLQASIDHVLVTSTEPNRGPALVKVADFSCITAARLFQPFNVEHNRVTLSSVITTNTLEESFGLSVSLFPSLSAELSGFLDLPPLNQDLNVAFESGSHRVHVHLYPVAVDVTSQERRLPALGYPKAQGQHLLRKAKKLEQTALRPTYALNLEISVVESDPIAESSIRAIHEEAFEYKKRILKAFTL